MFFNSMQQSIAKTQRTAWHGMEQVQHRLQAEVDGVQSLGPNGRVVLKGR